MAKQNKSLNGRNASATAGVTFNRNAVIQAMTALAVGALQAFDYARTDYKASEGERNAMLLESMTTARAKCGKDTGAYLGVCDEVFGNGVKGKANTPGTVKETLKAGKAIVNEDSLKSALSKARKIARWLADPQHSILNGEGKPHQLDVLVGIIDGSHDATGKRIPKATGADTGTAVTPASIALQIKAWCKDGYAGDVGDAFAAWLKAGRSKAVIALGAAMVDLSEDVKAATGK